jgi:hypothetical protein
MATDGSSQVLSLKLSDVPAAAAEGDDRTSS